MTGQAAECCPYMVLPFTDEPAVLVVDCNYNGHPSTGGAAIVRANASCLCPAPLATEPTTWGKVKSLYR